MYCEDCIWGFALAIFATAWFVLLISSLTFPWNSWLLIALGMLMAVVVALQACFSQARAFQPRPHDDAPYDVASASEQAYFSANPSRE